MATPLYSPFLYAFLLLMYPSCSVQKYLSTHNLIVSSLLASDHCMHNRSSKVEKQGSSLEVVHKYGPCSDLKYNQEMKTGFSIPNQAEMLLQDQARVYGIHHRFSEPPAQFNETKATVPVQSGAAIGVGNYIVTVAIGTPKKDLTLVFDTGSGITWTQCEPCAGSCYSQSQPIFDPRKSSSYKNVSCSSSYCKLITDEGGARSCSSSTCLYQVRYGDGSYSVGFFASEKLTISSSDVFNGILFGCGQRNAGRFGRVAGLLGLGPGQLSFATQTANKYKKLFSYCIPSSPNSVGHLTFGQTPPKAVKYTPQSPHFKDSPYYGIDIIGISVGGRRLAIDASVFSSSGSIIDSGTVITRLQPKAYGALRAAFEDSMKDYQKTDGISILDTCYDLSGYDKISIPKISIIFKGGIELEIKPYGILLAVGDLKHVCLAFSANDDDGDFAIVGNTQQKTYEVVHDVANERIGFAAAACS